MYNLTAGWVRWSAPPPQHHNGNLLGYKIEVNQLHQPVSFSPRTSINFLFSLLIFFFGQVTAGNTMKVLANMTLNSTTTSVLLNNLTTGATYSVRLNSFTKAGEGPYSQPVSQNFYFLFST